MIEREQLCWRVVDVERLIVADHAARAIWEFLGQLDLSGYQKRCERWGQAGRPDGDVTDQPVGICVQRRIRISASDRGAV